MADDTNDTSAAGGGIESSRPPMAESAPPGAPLNVPASQSGDLKKDIAQILEDVRLPERRDFKGGADFRPPTELHPALAHMKEGEEPARVSEVLEEKGGTRAAAPAEQGHAPPQQASGSEMQERTQPVVALHTMRGDIQDVVRERKISYVRAAAMEEKKRHDDEGGVQISASKKDKSRLLLIIVSVVVFLGLGGAALTGVYFLVHGAGTSQPSTSPSLVFAEQTLALPIDNETPQSLKQALGAVVRQATGKLGSITRIVPVETVNESGGARTKPATLERFLEALGANPPPDLLRSLSSDFFLGVHTVDVNAPLFIVPVTSYDHAFAAMLSWESSMNEELAPPFEKPSAIAASSTTLPSSRGFEDAVIRNYDVRALRDGAGTIVFYYSFPTQSLLVIAQSPYSFSEILSRLQAERRL